MSPAEIQEVILDILGDIAPDEDLSDLKDDVPLREQLELDSMDFLDIVMELRKRYRVQIPEDDYVELASHAEHRTLPGAADEATLHRPDRNRCHHSPPTDPIRKHVRHDHHRRGHVGPGGRHSLGLLRTPRLHSRAAHDDRRAEFLLPTAAAATTTSACTRSPTSPRPARRKGRWRKLLRQLRMRWDDFALVPQVGSSIAFPGMTLGFQNDFEYFAAKSPRTFRPKSTTSSGSSTGYWTTTIWVAPRAGAARLATSSAESIRDPLLVEMLFCPLMFYGRRAEHDMDFAQFSVLFRSIFFEGLARPMAGIRLILKKLVPQISSELGGELRLRAGVSRLATSAGRVRLGACSTMGRNWPPHDVLSSAGWVETMRLCEECRQRRPSARPASSRSSKRFRP